MSLGITANKKLIANLIILLCDRIPYLCQTKLLKLLYLIDEESVRETGVPITWLEYEVWEKGPVAKDVYYSKNKCENRFNGYISFELSGERCYVKPLKQFDDSEFTRAELALINKIIDKFGSKTSNELIAYTHREGSLWSDTKKKNNIRFSNCNHISDAIIDFRQLIQDDGFKMTAYEAGLENIEIQSMLS